MSCIVSVLFYRKMHDTRGSFFLRSLIFLVYAMIFLPYRAPLFNGMCFEKASVTPVLEVGPVLSLYR